MGLITENDVLKVGPALIEITRQRAELAKRGDGNGVCYSESCAMFSDQLGVHQGRQLVLGAVWPSACRRYRGNRVAKFKLTQGDGCVRCGS